MNAAEDTIIENNAAHYRGELRAALPAEIFRREPQRLLLLAVHVLLAAAGMTIIGLGIGGLWAAIPASILIGGSFGSLAFVAHEILHGAVVRGRGWQLLLGGIAFLPFTISPRLWIAWHNKAHHGRTMTVAGDDPDSGGLLANYRSNGAMRVFDRLTVGRRRPLGVFLFLIGFNAQGLRVLLSMARQLNYLSPRQFMIAIVETLFAFALWTALGLSIGLVAFTFAFLIPLAIGNMIVMSYILTNHNLSPLTETNDPLLNSLSVTTPRAIEVLHLNFGLHVEHHLFPSMSSRHAERVREELVARWPERYQSMPLHRAVARLWSTARIYADNHTLTCPRSGRRWTVLLPR